MALISNMARSVNFVKGLGNNRNKYFAIKDANRRSSLRKANFFFKFFNIIALIVFYLSFALLAVFGIFSIFTLFKVETFTQISLYSLIALSASLAIIIIFTFFNYLVDGIFVKKEIKELKSTNTPEDQKYIIIGESFLKLRKTYFITSFIFLVLVCIAAFLILSEYMIPGIIVAIISVIPLFVYFGKTKKTYRIISPQIQEVIEERKELKRLTK